MTLCSPRFLFRLFTPLWMVSMWISVNFRINPFMHEVNDSSICLRIYSIDAIMQSKRQNFIQTTRPTLNKLAILKWPFLLRYTTAHSLLSITTPTTPTKELYKNKNKNFTVQLCIISTNLDTMIRLIYMIFNNINNTCGRRRGRDWQ
jgi:hypothetical protein